MASDQDQDHAGPNPVINALVNAKTGAAVSAILAETQHFGEVVTVDDGSPEEERAATWSRQFLLLRANDGGTIPVEILARDAHGQLTTAPERVSGFVTLETPESLADYVNAFKGPGSRLFASVTENAIEASLDYHTPGKADAAGEGPAASTDHAAGFGEHAARLALAYSAEWATWTGIDGVMQDQAAFARFLYENRGDVAWPDAATLIECAKDLRTKRTVHFDGEVSLNSDILQIDYSDKTDLSRKSGSLDIPTALRLRLPVYFGDDASEIEAVLRTDTEGGKLKLGVKLLRRENVRQAAFKRIVGQVQDATTVPAVYGRRRPADAARCDAFHIHTG
jgi:uncharacterized protein YfdQ (DUF2303 family)